MTTREAFSALLAKFPGSKVEAWHWIEVGDDGAEESFLVKVDGEAFSSCKEPSTFEEVIAKAKFPDLTLRILELREKSESLLSLLRQTEELEAKQKRQSHE